MTCEYFICLTVGIFDCPLCGLLPQYHSKGVVLLFFQCESVEWLLHQSRGTGCRISAYAPCMLTQVLPPVAEQ